MKELISLNLMKLLHWYVSLLLHDILNLETVLFRIMWVSKTIFENIQKELQQYSADKCKENLIIIFCWFLVR